jgi:ABC-2 type transport system permease protein
MTALAQLRQRFPARPRGPRPGWLVVANKEFGDHVTSIRFTVLLLILAAAIAPPLYFASGTIRDLAAQASGQPAVFLALFTLGPQDPSVPSILRFDIFVGLLAPLLGIAFGFDAVNVERTEGTLPRLVAQPIHRDDVINGKFAAGLTTIALMLGALTLLVAGFGIFRLGIVPSVNEVVRLIVWYVLTIAYVGFWLAFATLLSVAVRRAAASALIAFGVWFFFMVFWSLLATLVAAVLAPSSSAAQQQLGNLQLQETISRLSPATLYQEE